MLEVSEIILHYSSYGEPKQIAEDLVMQQNPLDQQILTKMRKPPLEVQEPKLPGLYRP